MPRKPGSELLRGADSIVEDRGVDLQTPDRVRIGRTAVPVVFDPQHRPALFGGDPPAQFLMPARDILVQVMQPQGQVDLPAAARPLTVTGT
jgi:hypothetical protein